ncbi:MAG: HD domain-containing protein [Oscillospiraceae bacterium]|nr:HD domain-containing protein [Oscillospiraceae bacterium]
MLMDDNMANLFVGKNMLRMFYEVYLAPLLRKRIMATELVELCDSITGGHVYRAQRYLQFLIEQMIREDVYTDEISEWDLDVVFSSAQLHDVGKIAISGAILNKPGKLTDEEFEIMKTHVQIGVDAIERIEAAASQREFLHHAKVIASTHHEKWDGSGYPRGLRGENIPLEGRLMAVADVYDALISARPYKEAFTAHEAERIMEEGRGVHFDPVLVDVFHAAAGRFAGLANQFREEMNILDGLKKCEGIHRRQNYLPVRQHAAV